MNKSPLISVCMPLYNAERYLAEAIEGILRQTYGRLELIICDNCSTDGSLEIAESYQKNDHRVQVVRNRRNIGYAGNLQKVTSLARGDLMMVHCADDTAEPHALERMVELASQPDVEPDKTIFISDAYVMDSSGQRTDVIIRSPEGFDNSLVPLVEYTPSGRQDRFQGREGLAYALPRLRTIGFLGAILYSRQLYNAVEGVYNGMLYSPDMHYMYNLLSHDPEIIWLQEPLFSWRLHDSNQISQERGAAILKQALDAYIYTFEYSPDFLAEYGITQEKLAHSFVDEYCLRKALAEIKDGNALLAFRYLCFALTTYPTLARRNPKFYVGLMGCLTGPIGRLLARAGYRAGWWRHRAASLQPPTPMKLGRLDP